MNLFIFFKTKQKESVLDQTTPDYEPNEIFEPLAQTDYQRLAVERQKFHTAIDTLDSALVRLQQLWISNVKLSFFYFSSKLIFVCFRCRMTVHRSNKIFL